MVKKCALLFVLYGFIVFTMDMQSSLIPMQPKATKTLFDCKDYCNRSVPWSHVMPKSILIVPDEKGIVMARNGGVLLFTFLDPKTGLQITEPTSIITHSRSHQVPKMVIADPKDKSLIVASAINYKKPDAENYISEYTRYHDGSYKTEKLKWLIYAIALDKTGNFLAIAGNDTIECVDFEKNRRCKRVIPDLKEGSFLVDIAINMATKMKAPIIAVDNYGTIQAMGLLEENDDFNLFRLTSYKTEDAIKKLLYADAESLLYVTHNDEIKKLDSYAVLGSEKGQKISIATCPSSCKLAVLYTGDCLTTAYWNSNKKEKLEVRESITVHIQDKQAQTKNMLKALFRNKQYKYKTEEGIFKTNSNYISLVALSPNCYVALTMDGILYRWKLEQLVAESGQNERQLRRRSKSYSGEKLPWVGTELNNLKEIVEQAEECNAEGITAEDVVLRTNSVPNVVSRKSKSLPDESGTKIHRARSASTAPVSGSSRTLSPRDGDSDKKQQKTSPRHKIDVLKKNSGPKSRDNSPSPMPSPKSRSSSKSPRSPRNSIDIKKNKDTQDS